MRLVRCDVVGCAEEFPTQHEGPGVMLPPGWRSEHWCEEREVPVPSQEMYLRMQGVEMGTVRETPRMQKVTAYGNAHICPKHPRGFELRPGVVSTPAPFGDPFSAPCVVELGKIPVPGEGEGSSN